MARDDQWCELCEDKLKSVLMANNVGREIGVCGQCASMCTEFTEVTGDDTQETRK